MIQIQSSIDWELANRVEDYFCEVENIHWTIIQKTEHDKHKLLGYFDTQEEASNSWNELRNIFPEISKDPEIQEVTEQDWKNEYKKYLKPWSYQGLHWVPVWEKESYHASEEDKVVLLDAGMAFGTGAHETTQLCAMRIIEYCQSFGVDIARKRMIDAGCGSGILAISAKLLGFGSVLGFDNDPEAVRISKENVESNGSAGAINFKTAGLEAIFPSEKGDLIVANILANILCQYCEILLKAVNSGGWLVLSGILEEEVQKVKETFCEKVKLIWGQYEVKSQNQGEWADLCFKRTDLSVIQ